MNREQEEALIGLVLGIPCLIIVGGVAVLVAYDRGMSFAPLLMFTGIVVWGGLGWLFPFIYRKIRKGKGKVSFDERDQLISKRATLAAYAVLWLYFVAVCVIAWLVVGPHGSISVNTMPLALVGGLIFFTLAQGLATLVQYGWTGRGEES